jgi:hypothetical protein
MLPTYEIAKKRCFFDSEKPVVSIEISIRQFLFFCIYLKYITEIIKIRRRSYTQHVRMLCITTERLYNITKNKTKPNTKEGLLFNEIIGITCTPYQDGFVCIHTKDSHEDRVRKKFVKILYKKISIICKGDWLVIARHPCELITQLFMIMGRENNDDSFLKIKSK